jgi:mannose-6-phosphate isomerase-like protein (cupin superfamily)
VAIYDEAAAAHLGRAGGTFYEEDLWLAKEEQRLRQSPHIIRAEDQVWEDSPHGRLRHIAHPRMNPLDYDLDAYIQELPPDGASGKHRHMAEEFVFVLEGRGFSLHWDVELTGMDDSGFLWKMQDKPKRFDWEAGDWMYIPANTAHQHFNADGEEVARFLSATSRIYKFLGCHDLEQLENAPDYRSGGKK